MKISSEPTRLQSIMFSLNMFLFMLAVTLLTVTGEFADCVGGRGRDYNYDLSGPDLTTLYNSKVYLAESMKTRLGSSSVIIGPISHSGVRVTLEDGSRWLIHKGCNFGDSSDTVVVDARHMSSNWRLDENPKKIQSKNFYGRKTVSDFVRAAGPTYNLLLWKVCHSATDDMMNQ